MDRVRAAYEEIGMAAELRTFFDDVPERLAEATPRDQPRRGLLDRRHQPWSGGRRS